MTEYQTESNGQSLDHEHRLSCVFCGCSDASANFLDDDDDND